MIFQTLKYKTIERSFYRKRVKLKTIATYNKPHKVKKVGVLVDATILQQTNLLSSISKHLSIPKQAIELFQFQEHDSKKELDSNACSVKSFGWFGSLKLNTLQEFVKKDFDLFINYGFSENLYSNIITLQSKSNFKIGFASEFTDLYDLSVTDSQKDIESFNTEVAKYLKILKIL
jgi:hypothetical protein